MGFAKAGYLSLSFTQNAIKNGIAGQYNCRIEKQKSGMAATTAIPHSLSAAAALASGMVGKNENE